MFVSCLTAHSLQFIRVILAVIVAITLPASCDTVTIETGELVLLTALPSVLDTVLSSVGQVPVPLERTLAFCTWWTYRRDYRRWWNVIGFFNKSVLEITVGSPKLSQLLCNFIKPSLVASIIQEYPLTWNTDMTAASIELLTGAGAILLHRSRIDLDVIWSVLQVLGKHCKSGAIILLNS